MKRGAIASGLAAGAVLAAALVAAEGALEPEAAPPKKPARPRVTGGCFIEVSPENLDAVSRRLARLLCAPELERDCLQAERQNFTPASADGAGEPTAYWAALPIRSDKPKLLRGLTRLGAKVSECAVSDSRFVDCDIAAELAKRGLSAMLALDPGGP